MDVKVLALAKKYTDDTMAGTGSIQGKNCTITDITHDAANKVNKVTFSWTENNGTVKTQIMSVPDGIDGLNVTSASIDANKHLILTMSDSTTIDAGLIPEQTVDLSGYVQKETGKGLSTNDYTNADKTAVGTISNKVDKVTGKGLSTNDYDATEKAEVAKIKDKVDKVAGKGLSTNDYDNTEKAEVAKVAGKVDKAQGVANKDKFLKVGADGNVTLGDVPSGTDIVTAWETTTSDSKVPSEKLVKDNLDKKIDVSQGVANKGKALVVGEDGNVTCGTVATDNLTIVDKTQAQYDVLTDAEKNDATKLYNITDADDLDLTSYAKQSDVDAINNNLANLFKYETKSMLLTISANTNSATSSAFSVSPPSGYKIFTMYATANDTGVLVSIRKNSNNTYALRVLASSTLTKEDISQYTLNIVYIKDI